MAAECPRVTSGPGTDPIRRPVLLWVMTHPRSDRTVCRTSRHCAPRGTGSLRAPHTSANDEGGHSESPLGYGLDLQTACRCLAVGPTFPRTWDLSGTWTCEAARGSPCTSFLGSTSCRAPRGARGHGPGRPAGLLSVGHREAPTK